MRSRPVWGLLAPGFKPYVAYAPVSPTDGSGDAGEEAYVPHQRESGQVDALLG